MAGAGFKTFSVGDVLTASDVNGYLMSQAVMNFASSGARGSAIGTATEGMLSYLADTDAVEVYDGSAWNAVGGGGFTAATAITATDASWTVPTLADPVVKVTVVGAGGGASAMYDRTGGINGQAGANGGTSTFSCSAGTATAAGGIGGVGSNTYNVNMAGIAGTDYLASGNGGSPSRDNYYDTSTGANGGGGAITVAYFDLTGVSTASVTVGAGGAGGAGGAAGGDGGDGVVIVEYRAG